MQVYDNAVKAYRPAALPHRDFVFWLQGFFEIANPEMLTPEQVKVIKDHLAMCFEHVALDPRGPAVAGLSLGHLAGQQQGIQAVAIC